MAYSSVFSLSVCFLVLVHGCFGQIDLVTNRRQSQHGQQQQPQQPSQTPCQLRNLNALEPKFRFRSEAGVTEFWDQNEDQFQCAGVAFLRHKIQRKGLLLPSFNNAPQLIFIVEGQGIQGAIFPGCPETFQSQSQSQSQSQHKQQSPEDQHQKIRPFKAGDVIALPAGVAHWIYNDGESQLVLVSLVHVGNVANQLDQNFRKFFLAGNPQQGLVSGGQHQSQSQRRSQRGQEEEQEQSGGANLLSGFDEELLAEIFGIEPRLVRKLQNEKDKRGAIVKVQHEIESPREEEEEQRQQGSQEEEEEEEESEEERSPRREERERGRRPGRHGGSGRRGSYNGLEETFCSMKLKHSTHSSFADVFNPRAGHITTVNSLNLPVLGYLQLSAERGVLYRDALYAPHWNNAHSLVYITRGRGRIQIVAENGEAVFDDHVEEGQVIVIPQNFAVVKKAGREGFEWIAFKTNGNAQISQIVGRVSVFRALPVDVLANSFGISRTEAMWLKQSRQEVSLFSPRQRPQQ